MSLEIFKKKQKHNVKYQSWRPNDVPSCVSHIFICPVTFIAHLLTKQPRLTVEAHSISWSLLEELSGYMDFNAAAMWFWTLHDRAGDEQQTGRLRFVIWGSFYHHIAFISLLHRIPALTTLSWNNTVSLIWTFPSFWDKFFIWASVLLSCMGEEITD